ncbi:alpha/beta family hydrolase [Rheinheimera sp.]|uniref:alpha/beta family hydrolase n=1 Tax=Rheinheimera sp. TaxID=1869214 RepID=UPI0027B91DE7|nr:alpha/beta family hydrolase [Rheinheimera sp.]
MLLLHGAGASVQSDYLTLLASELAKNSIEVWRVNFAYMQKSLNGSKQPPPVVVKLQQELADFIALVPDDLPLFIGGKSMGGRVATLFAAAVASQLASEISSEPAASSAQLQARIKGICCFGYPFCPPAKKALGIAARTEHFKTLKLPVLIIQGERDEFGGKALESELHAANWPELTLNWLPFGDHDLKTLKKHAMSQQELITLAATASRDFIDAKLLAA